MREYKVVVLGAGGVGKSALSVQFSQGVFLDSYDPTIEDSYCKQVDVDGRPCMLEILDTAGVEQFTAMRELYIKNGQGFLLVYSVTDRSSLLELSKLYEQVCRIKGTKTVPIVLAGNKCDLAHGRTVPFQEAKHLAHKWGTNSFYETSARTGVHVNDVFVDVIRQIQRRDSASSSSNASTHSASRVPTPTEKHRHTHSAASTIGGYETDRRRSSKRSSGKHSEAGLSTTYSKHKQKKKKAGGLCVIL